MASSYMRRKPTQGKCSLQMNYRFLMSKIISVYKGLCNCFVFGEIKKILKNHQKFQSTLSLIRNQK